MNPDLITQDQNGEPYTVRYEAINAMLLNEFLKQHRKNEEQEASITELKSTIAQLKSGIGVLTTAVKEQAAQIERVRVQFDSAKPPLQMVLNNP